MRQIQKHPKPQVLEENEEAWLADYLADPTNSTRKYRYRNRDIKNALKAETASKCIYCESRIGHNTPGDVEHKIPSSLVPERHFDWANLTIACGECNRRKNNYYNQMRPFLDPNVDEVELRVRHLGPVVSWQPGDTSAEITVKTLNLHDNRRPELILQKVEKLAEINDAKEQLDRETDPHRRLILEAKLDQYKSVKSEYSAMARSVLGDG